jgi:Zn-dependent protease with chaperone function
MNVTTAFLLDFLVVSTFALGSTIVIGRFSALAVRELAWKSALILCLVVPLGNAVASLWQRQQGERVSLFVQDTRALEEFHAHTAAPVPAPPVMVRRLSHAMFLVRELTTGAVMVVGSLALFRMLLHWRRGLRRLGPRRPLDPTAWLATRAAQLGADLRLAHQVRLTVAPGLTVPAVLASGEICLPEHTPEQFAAAQLEAIVAHELAHIQRRDLEWLRFVELLQALFIFQPLLRVARRELKTIAEFRADDAAVQCTGNRSALVEALLACARRVPEVHAGVLAFGQRDSRLVQRVRRILAGINCVPTRRGGSWLFALVLLIGVTPGVFSLLPSSRPDAVAEIVTRAAAPRPVGPLIHLSETTPRGQREAIVTRAPNGTLQTEFRENGHPIAATPELTAWLGMRLPQHRQQPR